MGAGGSDHLGVIATQERVHLALAFHHGRQGGQRAAAQTLAEYLVLRDGGIARLHGTGKAQVGERVFVRTAYARVAGQGRQLLQRGQHLRRRAFEKPAAAGREHGVAAKEQGRLSRGFGHVGDVPGGVARHIKDLEAQAQQADLVAAAQLVHCHRQGLGGRAVHGAFQQGQQIGHTPHVVGMVMGH